MKAFVPISENHFLLFPFPAIFHTNCPKYLDTFGPFSYACPEISFLPFLNAHTWGQIYFLLDSLYCDGNGSYGSGRSQRTLKEKMMKIQTSHHGDLNICNALSNTVSFRKYFSIHSISEIFYTD